MERSSKGRLELINNQKVIGNRSKNDSLAYQIMTVINNHKKWLLLKFLNQQALVVLKR